MKKLVFLLMISAVSSFAVNAQTNNQTTGEKIKDKTKKVAKATGKGLEKGYDASKNTIVKGAKATISGMKKIFT